MYILGLSSSWGTREYVQHWSPFEHQLTPALSPIRGPRPKPCRPKEVVYSPNDSCSHFTQRLFPRKLPQQHTCTIFSTHLLSFLLIIHHIQASIYIHLLQDKSFYHFFGSSWQADCSRSLVSDTGTYIGKESEGSRHRRRNVRETEGKRQRGTDRGE
jgi:hypothetical protein